MTFDKAKFFDHCRAGFMGPTLDADEVSGCNAILEAMSGLPLSWTAYALATAWHETAHTMQPVKEYGGPSYFFRMYDPQGQRPAVAARLGNTKAGDGVKYAGRGYVQLTGRSNYAKAAVKLSQDILAQPDLAMRRDFAADIMRLGMIEGWITGKGFSDYLPTKEGAARSGFKLARRIINGTDKADDIAEYAMQFQIALQAGSWS
jgi:putative chitinase